MQLFFGRRRWASRVVEKAGFPSGSGEAEVLIDVLIPASRENSKQLPTAEQVLFAALRLFHDQTVIAKVAKELAVSQLAAEVSLAKLPKAAIDLGSEHRMQQFVEVAKRIHMP